MLSRRIPRLAIGILVMLGVAGPAAPPSAGAAIVCQKKKSVFLRSGPKCKGKREKLVVDLSTLAQTSAVDTAVNGVKGKVGVVENELGLQCLKAATKNFAQASVIGTPAVRVTGCRTLDGKANECANAFEAHPDGSWSCYYYRDHCLACDRYTEGLRACVNACDPPQCPSAPSRVYVLDCGYLPQAECEAGFQLRGTAPERPESCRWVVAAEADCVSCGEGEEQAGACSNACGAPLHHCTSRPGAPTNCNAITKQSCESRWLVEDDIPRSCAWDDKGAFCYLCDQRSEFLDKTCNNGC